MRALYDTVSNRIPVLQRTGVKQFIKFSLVGVTNTIIDFSAYFFLTRVLAVHFLVANIISFTIAVSWSYFLNKRWTFRDTDTRTGVQFFKFVLVNIVGLALNEGTLSLVVLVFGAHDLAAKLIAVVIVVIWNFFINRTWTFTQHSGKVAPEA